MIGLLPAAGQATRFNGFPKFLLPVPEGNLLALHCRRMRDAGASRILIGSSIHNAETIARYRPAETEMYMGGATMSETVLNAREDCGDESVLFGMPDTYWHTPGAYKSLAGRLGFAHVIVAVWKIRPEQRGLLGQCKLNQLDVVEEVTDKQPDCPFEWAWGAMCWRREFWEYIKADTPHIGYALQPAINNGLRILAYRVEGDYFDCGAFNQYARLCSTFVQEVTR